MLEDSDAVIDTASIQISQNADATAGGHLFRQKRDRRGFGFVADDLNSAKKELGDWRAVDIALDRTPSFVKGLQCMVGGRDNRPAVPQPILVIEP